MEPHLIEEAPSTKETDLLPQKARASRLQTQRLGWPHSFPIVSRPKALRPLPPQPTAILSHSGIVRLSLNRAVFERDTS